jgi:hypothetical protein
VPRALDFEAGDPCWATLTTAGFEASPPAIVASSNSACMSEGRDRGHVGVVAALADPIHPQLKGANIDISCCKSGDSRSDVRTPQL